MGRVRPSARTELAHSRRLTTAAQHRPQPPTGIHLQQHARNGIRPYLLYSSPVPATANACPILTNYLTATSSCTVHQACATPIPSHGHFRCASAGATTSSRHQCLPVMLLSNRRPVMRQRTCATLPSGPRLTTSPLPPGPNSSHHALNDGRTDHNHRNPTSASRTYLAPARYLLGCSPVPGMQLPLIVCRAISS